MVAPGIPALSIEEINDSMKGVFPMTSSYKTKDGAEVRITMNAPIFVEAPEDDEIDREFIKWAAAIVFLIGFFIYTL